MAEMEIDSFVSKLKSLWAAGLSATLHVETEGGKASIYLKADVGYLPPPVVNPKRQHRGPAYRRRQARRSQNCNIERNTVEGYEAAVEAADTEVSNQTSNVTDQVSLLTDGKASEVDKVNVGIGVNMEMQNVTDLETYELKIKELTEKVVELEHETESQRETIAVNDMLYEDFKERVRDKYLYNSDDEVSDYQSDEESRKFLRQEFWKTKLEQRGLFKNVTENVDKFA